MLDTTLESAGLRDVTTSDVTASNDVPPGIASHNGGGVIGMVDTRIGLMSFDSPVLARRT